MKKPPFQITNKILNLIAQIVEIFAQIGYLKLIGPDLELRRINRVKSIQSSLAIEGNQLSEETVSAIINRTMGMGVGAPTPAAWLSTILR